VNEKTNTCIAIQGQAPVKHSLISVANCTDKDDSLKWRLFQDGTIRAAIRPDYCIDLKDGDGKPGASFHLMECAVNSTNQRFYWDQEMFRLWAKRRTGMVIWGHSKMIRVGSLRGEDNQFFAMKNATWVGIKPFPYTSDDPNAAPNVPARAKTYQEVALLTGQRLDPCKVISEGLAAHCLDIMSCKQWGGKELSFSESTGCQRYQMWSPPIRCCQFPFN